MTDRFDSELEPGEIIAYRAQRRWTSNTMPIEFIAGYLIPIAIAAGTGLLRFDWIGLASLGAALAGILIYTAYYYVRDRSREAIVTNRRLLYRSGWLTSTTTVSLKDIGQVQVSNDQMRLTLRNAASLILGHPQHAMDLGRAVALAANLPPPRVPPVGERLANWVFAICIQTVGIAAAVSVLTHFYPEFVEIAALHGRLWATAGFVIIGWSLHAVGLTVGHLLPPLMLRLVFTYEDMKAWMENSEAYWPLSNDEPTRGPTAHWSWGIVNVLYGRSPFAR